MSYDLCLDVKPDADGWIRIRCDQCHRALYETDQMSVRAPVGEEMPHSPMPVTFANRLRVQFCSTSCFKRFVADLPDDDVFEFRHLEKAP